jgi:hypothetical protein
VSELPGRPNLDQLRRQARELLRAAADGEPSALTRIRAVSQRMSLAAAQLAVARDHGFASWPALHAEVGRRLAELPPQEGAGPTEARWSFGGAGAVETPAGVLQPGLLFAGPDHAALDAVLIPSQEIEHRPLPAPSASREKDAMEAWSTNALIPVIRANYKAMKAAVEAVIGAVAVTDDQGTTYAVQVAQMPSGGNRGQDRRPVSLSLRVDPVPSRERGWIELRGPGGSTARLLPSARPQAHVSHRAPLPGSPSPAERDLSDRALGLIGLLLSGTGQDAMEEYCSAALARTAEIRQSGESGATGELAAHLARLCAFLTGHGPASGLPREWSCMIDAANRTDGARHHLDISASLPPIDETVVRADGLASGPTSWKVRLRAAPGWWNYSADGNRKRFVLSVHAEDDLGGKYVTGFGGSVRKDNVEELALNFMPRLNPLARAVTLTFSGTGEQVALEVRLP